MIHPRTRSARSLRRALVLVGLSSATLVAGVASAAPVAARAHPADLDLPAAAATRAVDDGALRALADSLRGRSGKLRARFVVPGRDLVMAALERFFGDSVPGNQGHVLALADSATRRTFAFIPLLPFDLKSGGRLANYRVGFWPAEKRAVRSVAYSNPEGFIQVTPENQDTYVSEHFRLRDFLTHDQEGVWPKYLVLREDLVDKLELVIADLEAHGTPVRHMVIMSGFRTPQYNARGVGRGGRAKDSRHQFGDAADVFVDNDGDGRMDDLNHDRRVDARDAQVIINAVERVEAAHPDLTGGAGRYRATRAHGPFAHIDTRGTRARWGNA